MSDTIAQRFIDALQALESKGDLGTLAGLFAADAEIGNVLVPEKFHGTKGARDFWKKYRDTFDTLRSAFRNRIIQDNRIALEWRTEGTTAVGGNRVEYEGVSILEVSEDRIKRFCAYFDPAALGRQMEGTESQP